MAQFEQCMSAQGVTLPQRPSGTGASANGSAPAGGAAPSGAPSGGTPPSGAPSAGKGSTPGTDQAPPGVDSTVWKKAQAACASYAPTQRNSR